MLKIVAMAYIRVITSTIELLVLTFTYLALLCQLFTSFSAYLPGVFFVFCLIHLTVAIFNKLGKLIFFWTILSYLELFCPRGMVTNSRTIQFKGPNGSVQYNLAQGRSQFFPYENNCKCYKKLVSRLWPMLFTHTCLFLI